MIIMPRKVQKRPFPIFGDDFKQPRITHLHSGVFVGYALSFNKRMSNNKTQTIIKSIESLDCNLKANQIHCGINRVGTESFSSFLFLLLLPNAVDNGVPSIAALLSWRTSTQHLAFYFGSKHVLNHA